MMDSVWNWLRGRSTARRSAVHVVIYTRAGCHLCEDACRVVTQEQRRHAFTLDVVDVDADPSLTARYGERVPVVVVNGKERFHGQVNRALLARMLVREKL